MSDTNRINTDYVAIILQRNRRHVYFDILMILTFLLKMPVGL